MVSARTLPERRNPLVHNEKTPTAEQLLERRRLGQTNLAVRPGQVGIINASKEHNLGLFDYAHLRVPLPKDLKGSAVFTLMDGVRYPESYFLMRRSSDGYISATGMFKAAFPWASLEEAENERKHHKGLATAGLEEIAGNVWIAPEEALILAEEYGMLPWITALLDPEPIEKGNRDKDGALIATPPKFVIPSKGNLLPPTPVSKPRKRERRSVSPSKASTPARKVASPRKPRTARKSTNAPMKDEAPVATASNVLQQVVENGTASSVVSESVGSETVRIEVDEKVERVGDVETTTRQVKVDMPASHPELPLPENTEDLLETAKKMVEEANKLEGRSNGVVVKKRKVADLEPEEEEKDGQRAKKARVLEETLRKEKVKTRAFIGLGAITAIGAFASYFL